MGGEPTEGGNPGDDSIGSDVVCPVPCCFPLTLTTICLKPGMMAVGPKYRKYGMRLRVLRLSDGAVTPSMCLKLRVFGEDEEPNEGLEAFAVMVVAVVV